MRWHRVASARRLGDEHEDQQSLLNLLPFVVLRLSLAFTCTLVSRASHRQPQNIFCFFTVSYVLIESMYLLGISTRMGTCTATPVRKLIGSDACVGGISHVLSSPSWAILTLTRSL